MSAPKLPAAPSAVALSEAQRAQVAMAEAMADAKANPRDETHPGGRYLVDDGVDDKGKRQYRLVNAYAGEFKEDQNPDEMRAKHERTTGLF